MLAVLSCLAIEHNPWLVLLAASVCIIGCSIALRIYDRALQSRRVQRAGWLFMSAVGAGFTIWSTHFIAMLGFSTPAPVSFDPGLTAFSLIIAVVGSLIGLGVGAGRRIPGQAALGGALLGLGISAMHYIGMVAYRVSGIIHWDSAYIVGSLVLAVIPSAAAIHVASLPRARWIAPTSIALLVAGIVGLHFTAMTAIGITPLDASLAVNQTEAFEAMALAVAAVGMTILAVGFVSYLIDGQNRYDARERMRHLSAHDGMTGLPNRLSLTRHIGQAVQRANETGGSFAAIAIDIYHFKEINDNHGHATGDEILRELGRRLARIELPDVFFARVGGDEFIAIAHLPPGHAPEGIVNPLKALFGVPIRFGDLYIPVEASFGVASFPRDAGDGEALLRNAEGAMVRAKAAGAQQVCYYDPGIDEELRQRRALAADLRQAIARNEFQLHYQVQACVETGRIRGFEALLRWRHPVRGFVPPMVFIPLAEAEGMISEIGRWVMRQACREACNWPSSQTVAVNLSPIEIVSPELPGVVAAILAETGLAPGRLEVELTESAIIRDTRRCLEVIQLLKSLGVQVALDDFGTGYSSLSLLRTFPFDRIKLDRSFVVEVESSREAMGIVKAVLALGDVLGVAVLAEGIETETQFTALGRAALKEAQGYLLGRPVPPEKLPEGDGLPMVLEIHQRGRQALPAEAASKRTQAATTGA